ncbi:MULTISPECIES: chromate transporter [unclassified Bacteroides]|uniref:chromate transporter n=1 Tax=unclassified Bacteroides TaxID=2646097 RepID=UPI0004E1C24A|nr:MULTISPECIES: chromate transporter [unclassified Bacteroides]
MIFLKLFLIFSKIGIFNFGGGYAMISLIQNEVVTKEHWMTPQEFTDMIAVSQMTPGPIGINAATYAGFTAVQNAGYSYEWCIVGSVLASLSVVWLPFTLMLMISHYLIKNKESYVVKSVFGGLRPAIVGLIAAAALVLMTEENFGNPKTDLYQFVVSVVLFVAAFIATRFFKTNILIVLAAGALAGIICYY